MTLPTGRVALLFSDIEGSTLLLRQLGAEYAHVLAEQRRIVRSAVAEHGGHEIGTEGDSFFVAFNSTAGAVAAAVDAQRGIADASWPVGATVRVRMGVETGHPLPFEDSYMGIDVHRAARIASAAHGGQLLVGPNAYADVADSPTEQVTFRDLGTHRLKDLPDAEPIHQAVIAGVPDIRTPIKSLGAPSNLPRPPGRLVGRADEVRTAAELLVSGTRLVTLTGPGGVGKTRLAMDVASAVVGHFDEGVYFVNLAEARTAGDAWTMIASSLGLGADDVPESAVRAHVASHRLLLLLDNLEQLPTAGEIVDALLLATDATILATSRGPLHRRAERELVVDPLPVDAAAIELFAEEAQRVRPSFVLDSATEPIVAAICRRLGGLPLAIELAAALVRLMSPAALAKSMEEGMASQLKSRDADRPSRQATVAATVEWSVELLAAPDRLAFARLGVLANGGDLDAVAAVLGGVAFEDALDVVESLADVSLVSLTEGFAGGPRISMLSVIRDVALDALARTGDDDARLRHAEHFADLAATATDELRGPMQLAWRDRIEREEDNIREALDWVGAAASVDAREVGLRLASSMGWYWYTRGRATEGRARIQQAIGTDADLTGGSFGRARADALHALGVLEQQQGDSDVAIAAFLQCLDYWRAGGDDNKVSRELNSLGVARWSAGQSVEARAHLEESAAIARRTGDDQRLAAARSNLGIVDMTTGDVADAVAPLEEALRLDTARDDRWAIAIDHCNLGAALAAGGRGAEACEHLLAIVDRVNELGDTDLIVSTIEAFGVAAAAHGAHEDAIALVCGAHALRVQTRLPRSGLEEAFLDRALEPARAAVDAATADAARRRGELIGFAELLELGRGLCTR